MATRSQWKTLFGNGMALIAAFASLSAFAVAEEEAQQKAQDVILMKNGDRLTGELVRKEDGTIKFKTPYAGTISISWDQVDEVQMGKPKTVLLADEQVMEADSFVNEDEEVAIAPSDGSPSINIATEDFSKVVPEPWELGVGGKFTGRVDFAMKRERGNTESSDIDFDYTMIYRRKDDRFRSNGIAEIDSDNGIQNKQEWTVDGTYHRFVNEKIYYGVFGELKQEKFADLNLRTSVGPLFGYQFFEGPRQNLSVEVAWLYVNEKFSSQPDDNYMGPGWHLQYDRWLWKKYLQFYHTQSGNVRIDDTEKFLWRSFTGLRLPLGGGFVGSAEYEIDYDGQPAKAADTTDTTFRLKLGYEW